jgi:hypothetical protein
MSIAVTVVAVHTKTMQPTVIAHLATCNEAAAAIRVFADKARVILPPSPHYGDFLLSAAQVAAHKGEPDLELHGVIHRKLLEKANQRLFMSVSY